MFSPERSALLIIDVQTKLAERMDRKDEFLANIRVLIQAAQALKIPVLWTEQVPAKLGPTVPALRQMFKKVMPIAKTAFSCCGEKAFLERLTQLKRSQMILAGIETHVCVYQTAFDLRKAGYEIQVVADAVASRTAQNKKIGLERMLAFGTAVTSTEMVVFELLKTAAHPQFKKIARLIK